MASTIRSIQGRGKLSLGHARLTSIKSMQSRHLPFAFLTSMTLANHSGCNAPKIPYNFIIKIIIYFGYKLSQLGYFPGIVK